MQFSIGNTPIKELQTEKGIFVKEEYKNPTGSIKDRTAFFMIAHAISRGVLKKGGKVVEASSGNTGIGLAYAGKEFGVAVTIVMPDFVSSEKIMLIKALGGKVVLTDGSRGMNGAISVAKMIARKEGAFIPDQFSNPANTLAHKFGTGPEILNQMQFKVQSFVAGVGTGGTIMGTGLVLKEFNPFVKIIAVEPEESPVLSGGKPGIHTIEGIGAGFVPKIFDRSIISEVIKIPQEEAWNEALRLCKEDGICGGPSTGANVLASRIIKKKYHLSRVITIAPDGISRYLSEFRI